MIPYIILYFFISFGFVVSLVDRTSSKYFVLFNAFFCMCFAALRFDVGLDYLAYHSYFNDLPEIRDAHMEKGFELFAVFIRVVGGDSCVMFGSIAAFIVSALTHFYNKSSKLPYLSFSIFVLTPLFYLVSINTVRQFIAIGFFAMAILNVFNKSSIRYLVLIIIGSIFHKSIIIMLPLFLLKNFKPSIYLYFLMTLLYVIMLQSLELLVDFLGFSTVYLDSNYFNSGVDFKAYIFMLVFMFFYIYRRKVQKINKHSYFYLHLFYLSVMILFTPLFTNLPSDPILRLGSYFTIISIPIMFADGIQVFSSKLVRNILKISLFVVLSIYFWTSLSFEGKKTKLVPYNVYYLSGGAFK